MLRVALTARQRHDGEPRLTTLGVCIPVSFAANGRSFDTRALVADTPAQEDLRR